MPYGNDIINNVDDIKKELKTLQQQSAEAISTNQKLVHALNKKNAGLAKLVLILALCIGQLTYLFNRSLTGNSNNINSFDNG